MAEHRKRVATWQVGPYPIDVYRYSSPIDEDDSLGEFVHRGVMPFEIRIAARLQGVASWAVIFHELAHAALYVAHLELGDAKEEQVCDAIAHLAETLCGSLGQSPISSHLGREKISRRRRK